MTKTQPDRPLPGLAVRPLVAADAAAAHSLVADAGWNQIEADWLLMIENGDAIGLFAGSGREKGELAATALMLPYGGQFAWISMVLVHKTWRRRGLATYLLKHCIETLRNRGVTPVLDATDAGREVYSPLGFRDLFRIERLESDGRDGGLLSAQTPAGISIRGLEPGDLGRVIEWDVACFGADRGPVLQSLRQRAPQQALVATRQDGQVAGFVLSRDGRLAQQIGPIIADDADTARALATAALKQTNGPVFVDAARHQEAFVDWLRGIGFQYQRGFTRMAFDRTRPFENPAKTFAIAGPELG